MSRPLDIVVITSQCLCKTHSFSTEISRDKLPLEASVCHCNSCRHSSGAMYVTETTWPQPREAVDLSGLARYQFSANLVNLFCGTCSTWMFCESSRHPSKLGVLTGTLNNVDADLIKLAGHIYVEDTIDGGASVWLRKPNADGKEIPRYRDRVNELPWDWPEAASSAPHEQESLPLWCHCKGVELRVSRRDYASKKREELPWYIDPRTTKLHASFDGCNSCRLQFGADIIHWTFVDLANISLADGSPFPKTAVELKAAVDKGDSAVGTLAYYKSSPGVERYFCKVCSASVFYACDERPKVVDVAIGLLQAPDGARAEGFLSWALGDPMVWLDDTKGGWREGRAMRVQAEAEAFRIARNYPKSWPRLEDEAETS